MKYVEYNKRGYVLLDIDQERIQGEFWHVATVDAPSREETLAAAFVNEAGANRLQPVVELPARPAWKSIQRPEHGNKTTGNGTASRTVKQPIEPA